MDGVSQPDKDPLYKMHTCVSHTRMHAHTHTPLCSIFLCPIKTRKLIRTQTFTFKITYKSIVLILSNGDSFKEYF